MDVFVHEYADMTPAVGKIIEQLKEYLWNTGVRVFVVEGARIRVEFDYIGLNIEYIGLNIEEVWDDEAGKQMQIRLSYTEDRMADIIRKVPVGLTAEVAARMLCKPLVQYARLGLEQHTKMMIPFPASLEKGRREAVKIKIDQALHVVEKICERWSLDHDLIERDDEG